MARMHEIFAAAAAGLVLSAAFAAAEARDHRTGAGEVRTLTIQPRTYLDPGRHPLPDATRRYILMDTQLRTPAYHHMRGRFGGETLPGPAGAFGPR